MRVTFAAALLVLALMFVASRPLVGQQPPQPAVPVFRSTVNLILVDVVVRDKKGAVVKGLTADDFQLVEDGKAQQIVTFAYEEISKTSQPLERASILAGAAPAAGAPRVAAPSAGTPAAAATRPAPLTSEDVKYSIEYTINPANKASRGPIFNRLSHVETDGPYRLHVHLKEPFSPWTKFLTKHMGVWPKDSREKLGNVRARLNHLFLDVDRECVSPAPVEAKRVHFRCPRPWS